MSLQRATQLVLNLNKFSDIALALLVVAVIGIMILPLPTPLMDALIACNMSVSMVMLVVSMYISSPLAFSVFPSLLLFTTLYRLALSIATTRLILLEADAGEIIFTFGNFVVGGNFIVGCVVFLILTIVQFLVITKGSERVAEVGARFTLDAMPGKQMSIDADMRAGTIDMDEARRRRSMVTQESQLYGAMDGAMKFVKGDAIAGLIITVVNIIGGVCIGIFQRGMTAGEALEIYALLTIGDGLVSQIPALMVSITAGIVVTRVGSDDTGHLGGQIGSQFLAHPKALVVGAAMILLFGLVPGFPKPQFFLLALFVGGVGWVFWKGLGRKEGESETEAQERLAKTLSPAVEKEAPKASAKDVETFSTTVPLLIDLAEGIRADIKPNLLNDEVIRVRRALYYDLGVPFPGINLRYSPSMPEGTYTILLHEVPMSKGWLMPSKILVRERRSNLDMMGFAYEEGETFIPGVPSLWMPESAAPRLDKAGMTYLTAPQLLTYHLSFLLKRNAGDFVGMQETRYLLTHMEERFAELVREVQRVMPVQKIAEIFQRLVQEQISIRNLRQILEALIDWGQKEKDSVLLTEYVRISLKRQISYQYGAGLNVLSAYMFDPGVEEAIRSSIRQTSSGSFLALPPETSASIVAKIRQEVGELTDSPPRPVLLTSMDIRRYVRKMIEQEFYELPVLSYQELTQEISVQPLGRIAI
jgi:type III secretion protein, HrcV family